MSGSPLDRCIERGIVPSDHARRVDTNSQQVLRSASSMIGDYFENWIAKISAQQHPSQATLDRGVVKRSASSRSVRQLLRRAQRSRGREGRRKIDGSGIVSTSFATWAPSKPVVNPAPIARAPLGRLVSYGSSVKPVIVVTSSADWPTPPRSRPCIAVRDSFPRHRRQDTRMPHGSRRHTERS